MIQLDQQLLLEHYSHVADLPFFPEIAEFMSSRPVLALVLEGEDVIKGIRDLLGPTDSTTAPPGTIRGDLGTDRMKNVAHASDSPESALVEINRFFEAGSDLRLIKFLPDEEAYRKSGDSFLPPDRSQFFRWWLL